MIKRKKILVIGDLMLDRYWMGSIDRISPEAPVPIIDIKKSVDKPGGAANVAKNLADFGMETILIGLTGKDEASLKLFELMSDLNLDYKPVEDPSIRTTVKLRVIDKNKQLMRLDHEDKNISKKILSFYKTIEEIIPTVDGIIISDYDKGVVKPIVQKVLTKASQLNIKTFVDPKGNNFNCYKKAFLLKPNLVEFEAIMGTSKNVKEFSSKAETLRKKLQLSYLLVTEGKDGMTLFEKNKITKFKAVLQDVFDVTGAGDTVISILSAYLSSGKTVSQAVKMANVAAGLSVQKLGSTSVTQKELINATEK